MPEPANFPNFIVFPADKKIKPKLSFSRLIPSPNFHTFPSQFNPPAPANGSDGPTPMTFAVAPSYTGPIHGIPLRDNPALKSYLDQQGLCYWCRSSKDHTADNCPKKANKADSFYTVLLSSFNGLDFLKCNLSIRNTPLVAMVDTGALGVCGNYISSSLAASLSLELSATPLSKSTEAINGSKVNHPWLNGCASL